MNRRQRGEGARTYAAKRLPWRSVAASFCFAACTDAAPELRQAELALLQQAIINGALAPQAEFDHTGALVAVAPPELGGAATNFCTATLIGPQVVVTAKHCAKEFARFERQGRSVQWRTGPDVLATGPNLSAPRASVRVVMARAAPGDLGGSVGQGRDVAVAVLDNPVSIPSVELRAFPQEGLGVPFLTTGYGVHSPAGALDGQRRLGRETVRATSGRLFEAVYGDFESYVEAGLTGRVGELDALALVGEGTLALFRLAYDRQLLLDEHEAVGVGTPSGQGTCRGDSGGPLLRLGPSGQWASYGVISGGPRSASSLCDFGTIYATFGPETLEFVRAARSWQDPCGEIDERGVCEGDSVVRCVSNFTAGVRRLEGEDCSAFSRRCLLEAGEPTCAPL